MNHKGLKKERGMSLIEAVVAIVIIGICLAGIFKLIDTMLSIATKTLERRQALLIANSYMEEILSRPVRDPSTGDICVTPPVNRVDFDDVCDYAGLVDLGAHDQNGQVIPGLEKYTITVYVGQQTTPIPDGYVDAPNAPAYLNLPGDSGEWSYLYIGVNVNYSTEVADRKLEYLNVSLSGARYVLPE